MNVMELFVTLAIKDTAYKQGLKDAEGNASSSTSKIGVGYDLQNALREELFNRGKQPWRLALPPPLHLQKRQQMPG